MKLLDGGQLAQGNAGASRKKRSKGPKEGMMITARNMPALAQLAGQFRVLRESRDLSRLRLEPASQSAVSLDRG